MAKKVILGTDIARDAFKTKVNDNFTELYNKDVALEEQINSLASKVIAESGSNPNGNYIKFEDGTAIFTREIEILDTTDVFFYSAGTPLPLAGDYRIFISVYDVGRPLDVEGVAQVGGYDIGGSYRYSVKLNRDTVPSPRKVIISILGVGRWE